VARNATWLLKIAVSVDRPGALAGESASESQLEQAQQAARNGGVCGMALIQRTRQVQIHPTRFLQQCASVHSHAERDLSDRLPETPGAYPHFDTARSQGPQPLLPLREPQDRVVKPVPGLSLLERAPPVYQHCLFGPLRQDLPDSASTFVEPTTRTRKPPRNSNDWHPRSSIRWYPSRCWSNVYKAD
jgi:hypothetical protein